MESIDSKKTLEEAGQKLKAGDFSAVPILIRGASFAYQRFGDFRAIGLANEEIGLPRDDIEADIRAILSE